MIYQINIKIFKVLTLSKRNIKHNILNVLITFYAIPLLAL